MDRTTRLGRNAFARRFATALCLPLLLVLASHDTQGG
jgi:hypothetical protein